MALNGTQRIFMLGHCAVNLDLPALIPRPPCLQFFRKAGKPETMKQRLGIARGRPIVGRAQAGMPEPDRQGRRECRFCTTAGMQEVERSRSQSRGAKICRAYRDVPVGVPTIGLAQAMLGKVLQFRPHGRPYPVLLGSDSSTSPRRGDPSFREGRTETTSSGRNCGFFPTEETVGCRTGDQFRA